MKKNESAALKEKISLLENKQAGELKSLREQLHITYESLKPMNFIKSTLQEVVSSPNIKNNVLNNILGLTTGYLSKKVVVGASHNPIKKFFGALLQLSIGNIVSNNADVIKKTGGHILQKIFKHKEVAKEDFSENTN